MDTAPGRLLSPVAFTRDDDRPTIILRFAAKVVHIDDGAIAALRPCTPRSCRGGRLLDLMSSWRSHLPADFARPPWWAGSERERWRTIHSSGATSFTT